MSSYMKTTIYGKLHQNLRGAVHLLCQMRWIDPIEDHSYASLAHYRLYAHVPTNAQLTDYTRMVWNISETIYCDLVRVRYAVVVIDSTLSSQR